MIRNVDIVRPRDLEQALDMRAELGEQGLPVAGGTDVIVELRGQRISGKTLVDLSRVEALKGITEGDDGILVGALTTHEEASGSALLLDRATALAQACGEVGSLQIRNRGTLGGNVANASPCADGLTALIGLAGIALVASTTGEREVSVEDLIERPYRTGLGPDEIIVGFRIPRSAAGARSHFVKLGRRDALAISRINAACLIETDGATVSACQLAVGSVMPRTERVREAEAAVEGAPASGETARLAGEAVSRRMIEMSGVRWSTPYKEPAVGAVVKRAVLGAMGLGDETTGAGLI
ncbi:MAG: FAD binding domain-containing protein [Deltaproteobacteria bacterium]|nr:FAD binding domain-containing protein [Deltaproteobacteria bacterium]